MKSKRSSYNGRDKCKEERRRGEDEGEKTRSRTEGIEGEEENECVFRRRREGEETDGKMDGMENRERRLD